MNAKTKMTSKPWHERVLKAVYREAEKQEFDRLITPMPQIYGFTVQSRIKFGDEVVSEERVVLCDGCGEKQGGGTRMVAVGSATEAAVKATVICPNCVAAAVALSAQPPITASNGAPATPA